MAVKIRIDFFSNTDGAKKSEKAILDIEKTSDKASRTMQQNWKDIAAAVGIAVIAFNRVKQFFDGLINTYEQQVIAETKLQGALNATGYAAGYSYEELTRMADGLAEVTIYADEAALEAEALLLTFTKIGKETFPGALEAAADMSTMFGQDLKQSVIQLGTALNDPIAGVGRLRRIGISFTQEQKDMIEGFVEMNDIMSAQAVILEEIQNEFGGVARAMGENALGQLKRLNNGWVDMQEKAGQAFLEGIEPLLKTMQEFTAFLESNIDIFTGIGEAIAFIGQVVISVIKFIIQFKEAIIAFVAVAFGIPAALNLALTAMVLFNSVILANPFALIIAGIVGAIAAIGNLVKKAQEAEATFRALTRESHDLASDVLLDAALGGVKNIGELQAAISSLDAQLDKLDAQSENANERQLNQILELIDVYSDLRRGIEKQIEIRKEAQLLEDAQAQNLVVYEDYQKALDVINRKMQKYRDLIDEIVAYRKKQAELAGQEYVPPDVSKLEKELQTWQDLADEVSATAEEVLKYGANFKEVLEKRTALEEDFNNKFFGLVNDRITILEQERDAAINEAEEVGAELADINAYYNELIRRENQKTIDDRVKFEEQYMRKYNELVLSRVELLEIERDEALVMAREKGAETLTIEKYYAELISRTRQDESQKAIEEEKKNLAELEAEYKAHAEARKRFQEDVVNYIVGLSDQWLLSESELLKKQRDEEIANVEEIAGRWREEIGYIVGSAGQVRLNIETPDEFIAGVTDIQLTQEEINAYTDQYNAKLQEALETEIRIGQAKEAITDEFQVQISAAENQERLTGIIGNNYLGYYETLKSVTGEMKTQEQVQRAVIQEQLSGLEQLITSVESNMALAGITANDIIQSLPYLQIIDQANEAIIFLQEELAKIPTEADKAFLELTGKVGVISQKYLDPLEKKKQVLTEELKQTTEYLAALRERQKVQQDHLETLDISGEIYAQEYQALLTMGEMVQEVEALADNISEQISDVDVAIQEGGEAGESTDLLAAALGGLASAARWLIDQLIQLITSTETWQRYMEDFNKILVNLMENAVIPLLDALQPVVLILIEVVTLVATLLVPVFQMLGQFVQSMMPLFVALGNIIVQVVAIFQALMPLIAIIAQLAGMILIPIVESLSRALGFLGEIVAALGPVFDVLGYVTDAVGRVFNTLWAIVGFILSPFKALAELLFYIITFQWGKIGAIKITSPKDLGKQLADIWQESWEGNKFQDFVIDPSTVPEIEMSIADINQIDPTGIGASIYGGNVSVQQAPDIYIYQTFTGNIIGSGGMVEVGEFVVEAIRDYVGAGGKVEFIEGGV